MLKVTLQANHFLSKFKKTEKGTFERYPTQSLKSFVRS